MFLKDYTVPVELELDLLRSFVAIVDLGSFSAAAEQVGRTQSAVSMQMRRLEEILNRRLFVREGRRMVLTTDGERLLEHARRLLRVHAEAVAAFEETELEGEVRIGSPDDFVFSFLPGILARFAEAHPKVHIELVCEPSCRLRPRIAAGSLDMALVTESGHEPDGILLHREPMVWVTSARHDVHLRDPLPLACFETGCPCRRFAMERLAEAGRRYRIALTSMSIAGIYAALDTGLAVTALMRSNLRPGHRILGEEEGFPPLPEAGITLLRTNGRSSPLLDGLENHIRDGFRRLAPRHHGAACEPPASRR